MFTAPRLWYFVMAAVGNEYRHRVSFPAQTNTARWVPQDLCFMRYKQKQQ